MRRELTYIVFWGEGGVWVSACLEVNLLSQGDTVEVAVAALRDSIYLMTKWEVGRGGSGWDWTLRPHRMRVPAKYRFMWANGESLLKLEGPPSRAVTYTGTLEIEPYRMLA